MAENQYGIGREQAAALIEKYLAADSMRKHCFASEAIMRSLASRFGENEELWGLVGLLHDLDYNQTKEKMDRHTLETEQILLAAGVDPEITDAIKYHNAENLGLARSKTIHFALTAAETITGMIVAAALVHPDKKIASLTTKSVKKRMKAKEFAKSVNRDHIKMCEEIGIPLDEFITISLESMNKISERLGL